MILDFFCLRANFGIFMGNSPSVGASVPPVGGNLAPPLFKASVGCEGMLYNLSTCDCCASLHPLKHCFLPSVLTHSIMPEVFSFLEKYFIISSEVYLPID